MRMGVKTEKACIENSMGEWIVFIKVWFFLFAIKLKDGFLNSKKINRNKSFIRQHYVLLLFYEMYRVSTLQMKIKKLNFYREFKKKLNKKIQCLTPRELDTDPKCGLGIQRAQRLLKTVWKMLFFKPPEKDCLCRSCA